MEGVNGGIGSAKDALSESETVHDKGKKRREAISDPISAAHFQDEGIGLGSVCEVKIVSIVPIPRQSILAEVVDYASTVKLNLIQHIGRGS